MKPSEIRAYKTYINRGAGRTKRTVVEIGAGICANWYGARSRRNVGMIGVKYQQGDKLRTLSLASFAAWAGKEAE